MIAAPTSLDTKQLASIRSGRRQDKPDVEGTDAETLADGTKTLNHRIRERHDQGSAKCHQRYACWDLDNEIEGRSHEYDLGILGDRLLTRNASLEKGRRRQIGCVKEDPTPGTFAPTIKLLITLLINTES